MKSGTRALGLAESYTGEESTLAGAVVRADRVVDGFSFGSCTVGGLDATDCVIDIWNDLDRPDVQYLFVAGVAPAWFNVLDLPRIHESVERPTLSVSFEESPGLGDAIRREFDDPGRRLAIYERQPPREEVVVDDESVFVRSVGCDDPASVVRAFTPAGGRPEPVRVARLAARAADDYRTG
ncbi:DUF99 family protein [Salarchaeum sp. JOR-1]|uniref:endonuclease dU n=1 Tax=Salarchaeum sp. JOR-1 TaxID=2599399 RepID=UPI001198BAC0|nr:DUF99 family protein [Salarchaeum sp. JOR-1]QDX40426.1 DUF99 family protein [Salarchaeum sp. JOR-1]